jgi:hypothetical protein
MVHMLTLLAAATMVKLAYSFPIDTHRTYDVVTVFDGFVPLFGGHDGKVEVDLAVTAKGVKPTPAGDAQVLSTLDDIKVILDGTPLNIVTLDSAKAYFPPTTISITPFGATLKTDAPDIQLPAKLPGLDIKRFPDITYLPLQLPEDGAEVGKPYSFKRAFGDSNVNYTVTPTDITDDQVTMNLTLEQTYEVLEGDSMEVVKDPRDAASKVKTTLEGKGTATFDRHLGVFKVVSIQAQAHGVVTDLATKKTSKRELKTAFDIKLRK